MSDINTFVVSGSKFSARADGRAALIFNLRDSEIPAVAFEIDLNAIAVIREQLTKAEAFLTAQTGRA